jgi:hypothetical protein
MKHYTALLLLSVIGVAFFGYHQATTDSRPDTAQAAVDNTVRLIRTLSWLGVYLSVCVGIVAHWLHRRLDRPVQETQHAGASTHEHTAA